MRDAFAHAFYETAKRNPKLFMVVADISPASKMTNFKAEFPSRFVDVGVAEQSLIGLSAGLALRGFRPFAYTIANFAIYRPFEQVRDDVCYQNLPVTIVGMGAGITYSPLGATHHTLEDVAVMSAIPNMTVLAPCDPAEVEEAVRFAATHSGPVYLRLGKAGEANLTKDAPEPFRFGRIRQIKAGTDICFLSYGPITKLACELVAKLEAERTISAAVYSVHTLKPLDTDGLTAVLARFPAVVILEEHVQRGGLSSQVKELAWDSSARCRLHTFALKDEFIHLYGSHDQLRSAHGLSVDQLYAAIC